MRKDSISSSRDRLWIGGRLNSSVSCLRTPSGDQAFTYCFHRVDPRSSQYSIIRGWAIYYDKINWFSDSSRSNDELDGSERNRRSTELPVSIIILDSSNPDTSSWTTRASWFVQVKRFAFEECDFGVRLGESSRTIRA
ncbi:unnamed protein product [Microthlaspi erraticum]|uniref:Uncharacterized protein n=1 Tax=Microthlaspi erraticum TaxID=1685480 RepID=A0A6D2JV51_9BRAS|nr:unnamed protein product [Microthlaspi erraticum]